jgi:hypothetical protein
VNDNPKALIAGFRQLADFLEQRPELHKYLEYASETFNIFIKRAELAEIARVMGPVRKHSVDHWFYLARDFGPVSLHAAITRDEVCQKVKTGTRVIPAQEARTVEIAATPERIEDVYEWKCPESILADPISSGITSSEVDELVAAAS